MPLEPNTPQEKTKKRYLILSVTESIIWPLMCTGLVALFLYFFKADGFPRILLCWTILSGILLFASYRMIKTPVWIRTIVKTMTLLCITLGAIALLVQLGATQRSLAEAWIELARNGEAFGFFSFFAAEIFAFLLIISLRFLAMKQYITGFCNIFAVCALCIGIIGGEQLSLAVAVLFIAVPLLFKKWQTFLVPGVCSVLIAFIAAGTGNATGGSLYSLISFDSSKIMMTLAPDFPLMVHIPGYGHSVKAGKPQSTVSLSSRTLFQVYGNPNKTHYFVTGRYISWTGESWLRDQKENQKPDIALYFTPESNLPQPPVILKLQLKLTDDFFSLIPCTDDTIAALLPLDFEPVSILSETDSSLEPTTGGLRRGHEIMLYLAETANFTGEELLKVQRSARFTLSPVEEINITYSKIPPRIKNLAANLMNQAEQIALTIETKDTANEIRRQYITLVLNYLKTDFTYSLKTDTAPSKEDPLEYFLFESKNGFCTWYAGAFTLLMHAQNIPSRVIEGYRVSLNENGQGQLSGMNAHAWSEVFIAGQWRIFEPTPVYTDKDPFRYIKEKDKYTIQQLSTIFDRRFISTNQNKTATRWHFASLQQFKPAAILCCLLLCSAGIFIFVYKKPQKQIVRHARRYVKKYSRLHISFPTETGWLKWKESVKASAGTPQERKTATLAADTADQMIELMYSHARTKPL